MNSKIDAMGEWHSTNDYQCHNGPAGVPAIPVTR